MKDSTRSVVRTGVPMLVGALVAAAAAKLEPFGLVLDENYQLLLVGWLSGIIYYAGARALEQLRSTRWGFLLGAIGSPIYEDGAHAGADQLARARLASGFNTVNELRSEIGSPIPTQIQFVDELGEAVDLNRYQINIMSTDAETEAGVITLEAIPLAPTVPAEYAPDPLADPIEDLLGPSNLTPLIELRNELTGLAHLSDDERQALKDAAEQ